MRSYHFGDCVSTIWDRERRRSSNVRRDILQSAFRSHRFAQGTDYYVSECLPDLAWPGGVGGLSGLSLALLAGGEPPLAPLGPGKHSLAPKMLSTQCYFLRLLTDLSVWPSHCCGLSPCNRFFLPPGGAIPAPPVPLPHLAPLWTSPRAHFEVERVIFQQRHSSCPAVTIK